MKAYILHLSVHFSIPEYLYIILSLPIFMYLIIAIEITLKTHHIT